MALSYTELTATTQNHIIPKLVDNIFTSNILFMRLKKKNYTKTASGNKLIVPVLYATTSSSAWYDGTESLTTTANDQISAAEFDWKQIDAPITISGKDEQINSGPEQIIKFVASKVQAAEKTITQNVGDGLYNVGTAAKEIIGLRLGVDSAGTYGGINRTTYSWWAAQEDSTSTALSLTLMQGLFGDATVGNAHPTLIPTTQDIYDVVWAKLQPQQRFQDQETAGAGYQNILFNGCPVAVDGRCPALHMFMLNEDYLGFEVFPKRDFSFQPFVKPTNQDAATAHIFWMGAFYCSNCRLQAKFGTIAG